MTSRPCPAPSARLQDLIYTVLGSPADWGRQPFQPASFLSKLQGHRPQVEGFPLPDDVERCAGCNTPHAGVCNNICYCKSCGEAWCFSCLADKGVAQGNCICCQELMPEEAVSCGVPCSVAAQQAKARPVCVSNIVLSWGSLVVTTGDNPAIGSTGVLPDTSWACGNRFGPPNAVTQPSALLSA